MKIKCGSYSPVVAMLCNVLLAYAIYFVCRVAFVWENWSLLSGGWSELNVWSLLVGGFRFDTSAIAYTNILYIVLMSVPLKIRYQCWWQTMTKWIFVVVNSLAMIVNLSDAVYSQFTGKRTTNTFFQEFSNDGNLGSVIGVELLNHWYLVLLGLVLIASMWFLYVKPDKDAETKKGYMKYYLKHSLLFLSIIAFSFVGMRGGITNKRPLTLSNATQYVNQPVETSIVLNTPFTVIRTIGKTVFEDPKYMSDSEMEKLYSPLHNEGADNTEPMRKKNVVILIVESFGQEYIGFYNRDLENGTYKGFTPFVDSLLGLSLTWEHCYANGRKSIEATPSLLASIPMFEEPFFFTGYSLNKLGGIANLLKNEGYTTAFFHGADNGSMNFESFSRAAGFDKYYGRNEYEADGRFGGKSDYDGTWAIWDEPFLQYYATMMNEMKQPFVTAVFTASSHHPFNIPDSYRNIYKEGSLPIHKCISYTDNALRRFFETARKQDWYNNTIFVFSADHTNQSEHDVYKSSQGLYRIPLFIYDPSGELPSGIYPGIAQQTDMMPTVLGILGYNKAYIAFGNDLLATPDEETWTVNYSNGIYQYMSRDTLIQFDGEKVTAVYDLKSDPMMKKSLEKAPNGAENKLKAMIQQYMQRMINDRLTVE